MTVIAQVQDSLPVHITLAFHDTWQGRLALTLTRLELVRRIPTAEIVEFTPGSGDIDSTDLLVLDGQSSDAGTSRFARLVAGSATSVGSIAWQGVHLVEDLGSSTPFGQLFARVRSVTVSDARTGARIRRLAPEIEISELADIGLLSPRLLGTPIVAHRPGVHGEERPGGRVLVDAGIYRAVEGALAALSDLSVVRMDAELPVEVVTAVGAADVVVSRDLRLLAVAFSLGCPLVPVQTGGVDDRLPVTFGVGLGLALNIEALPGAVSESGRWVADRALLPALQSELDAHFDQLATLATESAWSRRRGAEVATPGAQRLDDGSARQLAMELNAYGNMARRVAEERHLVVARDREVALERNRLAHRLAELEALEAEFMATRYELAALRQTRTFRYTASLRSAYVRALAALGRR